MLPEVARAATVPNVGNVYSPYRYWLLELLKPPNLPIRVVPSYTHTKSHQASSWNSLNVREIMVVPTIVQ